MGTANIDKPEDFYEVLVGDETVYSGTNKETAYNTYRDLPSGKGKPFSQRRKLLKCKILKQDLR